MIKNNLACDFQMHDQCTMPQLPPWQQIHKVTGAQSTVVYMWKFHRQNLITTAHLLTSKWATTKKSHIPRWNMVSRPWNAVNNTRLCARKFGIDIGIAAWRCCEREAISNEKISKTTNMTSILMPADQMELASGLGSCMVGGSSDSCSFCQFLRDSAENRKIVTQGTQALESVSLLLLPSISTVII